MELLKYLSLTAFLDVPRVSSYEFVSLQASNVQFNCLSVRYMQALDFSLVGQPASMTRF